MFDFGLSRKVLGPVMVSVLLAPLAVLGADAKSGEATFKMSCSLCHGSDGSGQTEVGRALGARDLRSDDVQKNSTADLIKIVHDGKNMMPPFKDTLSSAQIQDVVAFVRTLAHKTK